jgi:hypothetical protein
MIAVQYVPNAGRMPALDNLPADIRAALQLLSTLPSVAGVVTGLESNGSTFLITFSDTIPAEYRKALNCFRGQRTRYIKVSADNKYMQLKFNYKASA